MSLELFPRPYVQQTDRTAAEELLHPQSSPIPCLGLAPSTRGWLWDVPAELWGHPGVSAGPSPPFCARTWGQVNKQQCCSWSYGVPALWVPSTGVAWGGVLGQGRAGCGHGLAPALALLWLWLLPWLCLWSWLWLWSGSGSDCGPCSGRGSALPLALAVSMSTGTPWAQPL